MGTARSKAQILNRTSEKKNCAKTRIKQYVFCQYVNACWNAEEKHYSNNKFSLFLTKATHRLSNNLIIASEIVNWWTLHQFNNNMHRLLDSLVVQCWLRVREVPASIPSQGPRHTKDVIKMVPLVPLFGTKHSKGKILALSQELR